MNRTCNNPFLVQSTKSTNQFSSFFRLIQTTHFFVLLLVIRKFICGLVYQKSEPNIAFDDDRSHWEIPKRYLHCIPDQTTSVFYSYVCLLGFWKFTLHRMTKMFQKGQKIRFSDFQMKNNHILHFLCPY